MDEIPCNEKERNIYIIKNLFVFSGEGEYSIDEYKTFILNQINILKGEIDKWEKCDKTNVVELDNYSLSEELRKSMDFLNEMYYNTTQIIEDGIKNQIVEVINNKFKLKI